MVFEYEKVARNGNTEKKSPVRWRIDFQILLSVLKVNWYIGSDVQQ